MYYSCHCIKRNGLQHDCRRTGCGGEPACLVLPDPLCAPSQLARARGLANSAPLTAHMRSQGGGGSSGATDSGPGSGKKFIVCELKGIVPDESGNKEHHCCKCLDRPAAHTSLPTTIKPSCCGPQVCVYQSAMATTTPKTNNADSSKCPCTCKSNLANMQSTIFAIDEKTATDIMAKFDRKELASVGSSRPGGNVKNVVGKEEICTRPGCIHWQPPPPCVWDAPCKADCFETPVGIQPGRNPLTGGGGFSKASTGYTSQIKQPHHRERMKLLTPEFYTGCSGNQGATSSGGPAAGLPMLVMKLC